jgi:hypothetical protein
LCIKKFKKLLKKTKNFRRIFNMKKIKSKKCLVLYLVWQTVMTIMLVFFLISFSFSAKINVVVKDDGGNSITTGKVGFAGIPNNSTTGDPDPEHINVIPLSSQGIATLDNASAGYSYIIAVDVPGYGPTAIDQIHNPSFVPVKINTDSDNKTIQRTMTQLPSYPPRGTIKFVISIPTSTVGMTSDSLNGKVIVADVRDRQTDAPVGLGLSTITASSNQGIVSVPVYVNNVWSANALTYRAFIGLMASQQYGMEVDISSPVVANQEVTIPVDFGQAMRAVKTSGSEQTAGIPPAFVGVVYSTSNIPIPGAKVELFRHSSTNPNKFDFAGAEKLAQTYTDSGGNFVFYNIPTSDTEGIAVQITKPGYIGQWDQNWSGKVMQPISPGEGYLYNISTMTIALPPYQLEQGLGSVKGKVFVWDAKLNQKVPVANATVNIWPNRDTWKADLTDQTSYYATGPNRSGKGNASSVTDSEGKFILTGLGPGNFDLTIWSEIIGKNSYTYSYGEDMKRSTETPRGGDDRRIRITTDTYKADVIKADGSFGDQDIQENGSNWLEIVISTIPDRSGEISGKIYFKDYERYGKTEIVEPITIYVREATYGQTTKIYTWTCPTGKIADIDRVSYTIYAATGTNYYLYLKSTKWAQVKQEDNMIDLVNKTSVSGKDMVLCPAGMLKVRVKDENGNIFVRTSKDLGGGKWETTNCKIRVYGQSYGDTEISEDGEGIIYGLAPGIYKVSAEIHRDISGSNVVLPYPITVVENVNIDVDKTTYLEIKMKPGCIVSVGGAAQYMPQLSTSSAGTYVAVGFPAGQTITGEFMTKTMFSANGPDEMKDPTLVGLIYDMSKNKWESSKPMPDGKYDFYLGYVNLFNPENPDMPENYHQSFTVFTKTTKDIKYDSKTSTATTIDFGSGTLGNATVTGKIIASKCFTEKDVEKIQTSGFAYFFKFIPAIMIYDQQGNFKGFSNAMPTKERFKAQDGWGAHVQRLEDFTYDWVSNELKNYPLEYWCEKLPAGKYTLVVTQPNYPPVIKQVNLVSGTNTVDINLDEAKIVGSSITGVVKSTDGVVLEGAIVAIQNKNANIQKEVKTDEQGQFSVVGIPAGVYRIEVSRSGYARSGDKISVGKDPVSVTLYLKKSDASISGRVYRSRFPALPLAGATIVAYDETENASNVKYLPVYKSITNESGDYYISGLISGHIYRVYLLEDTFKIDGKKQRYKLTWKYVTPYPGENIGIDFDATPAPLRLNITSKRILENNRISYQFTITCPNRIVNPKNRDLPAAPYVRYSPVNSPDAPFDESNATELLVEPGTDNTYSVTFQPTSDNEYFKLRILATDGVNNYFEDILFGPKIDARTKKDVINEMAVDGTVEMDVTGADTTKIGLDPGAITPAGYSEITEEGGTTPIGGFLTSLPNFQLSRTQSSKSVAMQKLVSSIVASDVYEINLSSAQLNRSITLSLKYDQNKVGEDEIAQLKIGRYNPLTDEWEIVPGEVTPDPLSGTVSIDIDSVGGTNARPVAKAKFDGKKFVINKAAPTSQTGIYAVFIQDPSTAKAYSGTEFKIYNFPNPFNLKTKNVTISSERVNSNTNHQIKGTMISYWLPSGKNGELKMYIYNLAGELVKTLDLGNKTGGYYYYVEWDGKNDNNEDCASGIYFLIAKLNGEKLNSKPLKMAIIK